MIKKVNFYMVKLHEVKNNKEIEYTHIKKMIVDIINRYAKKSGAFPTLDLTLQEDDFHYTADIFEWENDFLFMRMSSQKASGEFLHRDYSTHIPKNVLDNENEEVEGIEVYTYAQLEYETGILSIINHRGAPNYEKFNRLFVKYKDGNYVTFAAIPNAYGIDRIYKAEEPKVSMVEIEVPVPDAQVLQDFFGWKDAEILNVQGNCLKATMKLSNLDRRVITDTGKKSKALIDLIKSGVPNYRKAKIRAKAEGVKMQDYNFFDENFTYPVDIPTYYISGEKKQHYTADQLVQFYRRHLSVAYKENKDVLREIANR